VFNNALDHAYRANCALLLSEFGATDDLRTFGQVCELADRNMLSWQYWAYFNADPSSARPQECIVRDLARLREGSNLNRAKAEVLSRPFPRAVAGIPRGWSFDPRGPEFCLRYATRDLHGNHFPEQATTEVFLPEHLFGEDPSIDVAGAQAVVVPGDTRSWSWSPTPAQPT
jgi:endoglycosylceramidase